MQWTSIVSEHAELGPALAESAGSVSDRLGSVPDLLLCFPSRHFAADYARLPAELARHVEPRFMLGCSAGAVIGGGREVEQHPAITVTAAVLPGVDIHPFHLEQEDLPDPDSSPRAWHEMLEVAPEPEPQFVLLADPFSLQVDRLLEGLDYAYPRSKKIGGLASAAAQPGANALFLDGRIWGVGAVGVALAGNLTVDTVVAQGCRPIGKPMTVTESRDNLLIAIDQKRPVEVLREVFTTLDQRDQELARTALHLGVLTDELGGSGAPGEFLIRNIIGIHPQHGVMAVGERLREGQTVQFHLRDARTSADDLSALLERYAKRSERQQAAGALLFSCMGRGMHLYGEPDHDTRLFQERLGAIPVGGFFCNGEIGPVGEATYLHGFTSSFGIFRPR